MKRHAIATALLVLGAVASVGSAAEPPELLNYQGVLRDDTDDAIDGTRDMVFRLYDAAGDASCDGGSLLLTDSHLAVGTGAVEFTDGLFNTHVGGGDVTPGTESSLTDVFRNQAAAYLEVTVQGEKLCPRIQVVSAGYSLNAHYLDGVSDEQFLRSDTDDTFSSGTLTIGAGATLDGIGTVQAGDFVDRDNAAFYLNPNSSSSGVFYGNLYLGHGIGTDNDLLYFDEGGEYLVWDDPQSRFEISDELAVSGPLQVGSMETTPVTYSRIGTGTPSSGSISGTNDLSVSGNLEVGGLAYLSRYLYMEGQVSGSDANQYLYFFDGGSPTGEALSWDDANDRFRLTDDLYISDAYYGIEASGTRAGGFFKDSNGSGEAKVGDAGYGIWAQGNDAGAYFEDANNFSFTWVAHGGYGIDAVGGTAGGYFNDRDGADSGLAYVGYGDRGIWGKGDFAGGTFSHPDNLTFWADVSTSTHKIVGTGTVSFVQNHPHETDKVIVYAAPEGDEVATYTRGTARLINGEARVPLGDTFRWVTNPDIGLTAYVTPREDCPGLYVASLGVEEMVVRELGGGSGDTVFDYIVYGLRIGFEEVGVLATKDREAPLPSGEVVEQVYAANPEFRRHNALERFRRMTASTAGIAVEKIDQSGAAALKEAIRAAGIHQVGKVDPDTEGSSPTAEDGDISRDESPSARDTEVVEAVATVVTSPPAEGPLVEQEHPVGFPHPLMPTGDTVEAGDVLVLDTEAPGSVRIAFGEVDRMVAGCAVFPGEERALLSGQVGVAVSGVIACRADADFGAIHVGDLLTTSPNPGHAMFAGEYARGAVLGKAVEPLDAGTGLIKVLVMLR